MLVRPHWRKISRSHQHLKEHKRQSFNSTIATGWLVVYQLEVSGKTVHCCLEQHYSQQPKCSSANEWMMEYYLLIKKKPYTEG